MQITPFIIGSGSAARAIRASLGILEISRPEIGLEPIRQVARGEAPVPGDATNPVLIVANPHALHAEAILAGERAGFPLIVCEKPVAVTPEQVAALRSVKVPVAVCHVYRQSWGVQTLKAMIDAGELGDIVTLEGRYWQSSVAAKSLQGRTSAGWKNDTSLSGPFDVLMDIGTHWADAAIYLAGDKPVETSVWRSYANAEAAHRDSHVHLQMTFPHGPRALSSISKNIHGAANHFEINVIGTKRYARWLFMDPDRIEIGEGSSQRVIARDRADIGSGQWPFHATGWLEGYIEIIAQAVRGLAGEPASYPTLDENLAMLEILLATVRR